MREQTLELGLSPDIRTHLEELSRSGTSFYNVALQQRLENPGILNRTRQKADLDTICRLAGTDPLPYTVAYQLLLELDVVTFTSARFQKRSLQHFYPLTWKSKDVEVNSDGILLQPDVRLPLPGLKDDSGILSRIRIRTIIGDLTVVHFTWRRIPMTGPGKGAKRAFGYGRVEGSVKEYLEMLISGVNLSQSRRIRGESLRKGKE